MEGKKISFGFMKTKKAEKAPVQEKREFIECVEEKSIKVVGGGEIKDETPLVIPMKPNTLITAERLKKIAEEVESAMNEPDPGEKPIEDSKAEEKPPDETLDQMAVRELLQEAKKEKKLESVELTVPVPAKPIMDGEKESSLEDYEAVPIQDFGMAMLRGMGWQPNKDQSKYKQPQLRPKGLGLGADKVVSENQKKKATKDNNQEELSIVKNSYVKITTGKYSRYYGKVVSLDEDNGRVMVDIPIKKETVSLSEFMMHPVNKSEFDKESKVINPNSFEEYKRNEKVSQNSSKNGSPKVERDGSTSKKDLDKNDRKESNKYYKSREKDNSNGRSRDKERHKRASSSSEDRSRRRKKEKKRYSSNDSLSSLSDDKRKNKKRHSSSDSDSPRDRRKRTPDGKRDIDKKRKGKKKKRDRDRSPNYRKHRK
ncbi:G-patch domain and KOW motifs-containing protein-like [Plodia interpunctella]|uniref:G-patch domain and KOW motifs-containing protein-like n=1 Tax=Plodia interpunctella TaxID=58824 RepID=UPI002367C99A|nr:G-patch domain and KOW motifs-containing protein-like [Plodia interpunctella]